MLFGTVSAWVYLRYYQRKGDVVGDLSSSFAFATFWPEYVYDDVMIVRKGRWGENAFWYIEHVGISA